MSNMTLKELIKSVQWEGVASEIWEMFNHMNDSEFYVLMDKYEEMFNELRTRTEPSYEYSRLIQIEEIEGNEDDNIPDYHDISLVDPETQEAHSASLTNWKNWLGFAICPETMDAYNPEEIVAICMYEMSWDGFSEDATDKVISELGSRFESFAKGDVET